MPGRWVNVAHRPADISSEWRHISTMPWLGAMKSQPMFSILKKQKPWLMQLTLSCTTPLTPMNWQRYLHPHTQRKKLTFRVVCIWLGNGGNQLLKIVNEDRSLLLFIWWWNIMSISSYSRQWLEWLDYYQTTGRINIDCQVPIYFRNDQIQNANNCILPSTIARVL